MEMKEIQFYAGISQQPTLLKKVWKTFILEMVSAALLVRQAGARK